MSRYYFVVHPSLAHTEATPISAAIGFTAFRHWLLNRFHYMLNPIPIAYSHKSNGLSDLRLPPLLLRVKDMGVDHIVFVYNFLPIGNWYLKIDF